MPQRPLAVGSGIVLAPTTFGRRFQVIGKIEPTDLPVGLLTAK
jgi:hypothetical protein